MAPSEQRVRVSRACNQCRKRKSRCGGEQPQCLTCESAGRTCTYESQVRKRGLQSGYVRSLEVVLGIALQNDPQLDAQIQRSIASHTQGRNALTPGRMHSFARKWTDSASAQGAAKSLISGQAWAESSDAVAANSYADDGGHRDDSVESAIRLDEAAIPKFEAGTAPTEPQQALFTHALPASTNELVDAYFIETHCWFPVLSKADLLRSSYTDLTADNGGDLRKVGTRLCLWAVIAYVSGCQDTIDADLSPNNIRAQVRCAIAACGDEYEISHVQALSILVLLEMAQGRYNSAWITSAQAWRMLINISLNGLRRDDREVRTFHGCALLETLVSSILFRTPCFAIKDFQAGTGRLDDESIDEWETWSPPVPDLQESVPPAKPRPLRSMTIFSFFLELAQKLHTHTSSLADEDSVFQQLTELQNWKQSLPVYVKISDSTSWTPPNVHLHTMWCYVFCNAAGNLNREHMPEQLVTDTIESTISLVDGYTQENSQSGRFSLLPCLFQRVIECLDLCSYRARADIVQRNEDRLHRISECGDGSHPMFRVVATMINTYGHNRNHTASELVGTGVRSSGIGSHGQQTPPVHLPISPVGSQSMPEAGNHNLSGAQAGTMQGPYNDFVRQPATTGSTSSINEFDAYFTQLSPILPTHRIDETQLFSQNLGFLGEDLNNYIYGGLGGTDNR